MIIPPLKQGKVSVFAILAAVIVLLAIGCAAAFFVREGATPDVAPGASGDPYEDTASWQQDERADAGFSIKYPIDFPTDDDRSLARVADWRANADGAPGVKAFTLTVPKAFEPNTNFSEAKLTAGYSDDAAAVAACLVPDPSGGLAEPAATTTIQGVDFGTFVSHDAGAGNRYDVTSYRTIHAGRCYAVEYVIHSTQLANYPESYGLTEFDAARVRALMDRIVGTFEFI